MPDTKIASVVVTYNRKRLLLRCVHALLGQSSPPDAIFIIDNGSTDGTTRSLKQEGIITAEPENPAAVWTHSRTVRTDKRGVDIHYVRFPSNRGGAYGFFEGMRYARKLDFDWVWIMDDDSRPHENALLKMKPYFSRPHTSAMAPAVRYPDGRIDGKHRGTIRFRHIFPRLQTPLPESVYCLGGPVPVDTSSFVGLLVKKQSMDCAGYPDPDFFLGHDDMEYCIRLGMHGDILLVPESTIYHEEAVKTDCRRVAFFGRTLYRPPYEKLWLSYYGFRNLIRLGKRYVKSGLMFYTEAFFYFLVHVVLIVLFDDRKLRRMRFYANALSDGLKGTADNEKPKKILYG